MINEATGNRTVSALTRGRGRGPGGQPAVLPRQASRCPAPGCGDRIDPTRLMCRHHWYWVPKHLRDQVWATWRSGQGAASREHQEAVRRAIAACQERSRPADRWSAA
jgi:hypothetical protein